MPLADRAKLRYLVDPAGGARGARLGVGAEHPNRLVDGRSHHDRLAFARSGVERSESLVQTPVGVAAAASEQNEPPWRLMQEKPSSGEGEMSMDTIAIVLSVLVAAAGYFGQAYTARRAEGVATKQAQELHFTELTRQREHEQMLAQIQRTDRCAPIGGKKSTRMIAFRHSSILIKR